MADKNLIEQLGIVLKKSRGEPSKFIELIICIRDLNQEGKTATCSKIVRKLWEEEWGQAEDKVNFEKVKWDLLCKRRRAINNRVLKSQLCFDFYIELTPEKQFLLIHDPEEIYSKRIEELDRNLAKATSASLKEKIRAAIIQLEYQFNDYKRRKSALRSTTWKRAAAVVIVVLIAAAAIFLIRSLNFSSPFSKEGAHLSQLPIVDLPREVSIAVLPFENMTGDPGQDFFSIGIAEDIITALSNLPGIQVIDGSAASANNDKTADMQQVHQNLNAHYLLEGSIRKTQDRMRITAQLSDVATGLHLWADRWDRDLNDAFAVQDNITMKIVTEIVVIFQAGEHARLYAKSTNNLEAFTKVIQGYHYFFQGSFDDTLRARQMCEDAIAIDPGYVAAYAMLADTYLKETEQGSGKPRTQLVDKAFDIIQAAFAMDGSDALVHNILSRVYTFQHRLDMALTEAKKAVDLYPNSVECINWQGLVLMRLGRPEEAIKLFNRSLSLNPKDPSLSYIFLGLACTEIKKYEEAISYFERFLILRPKSVLESFHLAALYVAVGREEDARVIVKKALSKDPTLTVSKVLQMTAGIKEKGPSHSKQLLENQLPKAGLP